MKLVSEPLGLEDKRGAKPLQITEARIDIQNVTFHYGKAAGVLDGINFSIRVANGSDLLAIQGRASRHSSI